MRHPKVRTAGNWLLSLLELYVRDPNADRYAVFQDDFVTYRNLRKYLEQIPYPTGGYLNLLTFMDNEQAIKDKPAGFHLASYVDTEEERERKRKLNMGGQDRQSGRGAVALVFDNEAAVALLSSKTLIKRFKDSTYGHRRIDGGVVHAMNELGFREYVHSPSLVFHTGEISSMGNSPHKNALSFRGEDFNVFDLLKEVRC